MNGFPYVLYMFIPFGIMAFVFYFNRMAKQRMVQAEAQSANTRAGEVAKRLGLTLVKGDPNVNFTYASTLLVKGDGSMPEVDVRLEGAPGGRHTQVQYYEKRTVQEGFDSTKYTTFFNAFLAVGVGAPFPEFELYTRKVPSHLGQITPDVAAPPQSFGDPSLDAQYMLKCADPRIAAVIADGLRTLVGQQVVHIVGRNQNLSFRFLHATVYMLGTPDPLQFALETMAKSIEQAARAYAPQAAVA